MPSSQADPFAAGCPAERRALFGLASVAVSGCVPPDLGIALAESIPLALARDAQRLQVHTLIGPVLTRHADLTTHMPADLVLFFRAMHAANRQRLAEGLAQLEEIGAALSAADIPAVVLKGGGDMLSPIHADPATRYVGDLDILVPINRAGDTLLALRDLGAAPVAPPARENSSFDWRGQRLPKHHLPRLVRSGWTFPVEIHLHAGPIAAAVLDPLEVLNRRVPTGIQGLSIACAEDRACHLLTHMTRHKGVVSLRAWIDWSALRRHCDRAAVASRLHYAGFGQTLESCDLVADLLEADGGRPLSRRETVVASNALCSLSASGVRPFTDLPRFIFRRCRGLVVSSAYRRHVADLLAERGCLRSVVAILGRYGSDRHLFRKLRRRPKE